MAVPPDFGLTSPGARQCPQCQTLCPTGTQYCPSCGFPIGTVQSRGTDKFIGTTLPTGYHILELIGVGGMGRVYRAEQSVLGRTVAVKIIHPHLLSDENSAARFLTEARASSQLNHPNSISVYDFGRTDDGQPYLVMELLRGKDLSQVIHDEGPLPHARVIDVLSQVLGALGEAHELGIIHRDLKPENIILQPLRRGGDFVKVVDFGLAKLRADAPGPSVTSPGIVCGTPDYMAPEQGRGDRIDGRTDLYAVGVMLFQLLTGRLPFEGDTPTQVVMMHLSVPAPDPRQIAPRREISAPLAEVVKRALAKSPQDRYQYAHEFIEALEGVRPGTQNDRSLSESGESMAPSLVAGETAICEACNFRVPLARYCCECAAPLPQDRSMKFPPPFIGRREDLNFLSSRRPTTATVQGARVVGETGLGKTRLLEEFASQAALAGDHVIHVETDPEGVRVAYHGLKSAIAALARLTSSSAATEEFADAMPDARRGLHEIFRGPTRGDSRSPMERRHGLCAAVKWALIQSAARGPGIPIILLDDLERLDGPSAHAFADLLGDPPNVPSLVIASHEPGFDPGWGAERTATRVLEGLAPADVRQVSGSQIPLPQKDAISPLFLEQALRLSFEGGAEIPERIGDLIAVRLATLEADTRRVLQGLAVLGFSAPVATVAELVQIDGIDASLNQLLLRGMIRVRDGVAEIGHPLLRTLTLATIPSEARRQLHRRALRLEDKRRAPLEVRAEHAHQCQEAFQALLLLEQVADRATALGDTRAEVFALRRGLEVARRELARGELDDPMRAVLIFSRKLGASLTRAGNFADANGILQEALDLAGPTSIDRAKILSALAHVSYGRKRYEEAVARIEQAARAARDAGATDLAESLDETRRAWAPENVLRPA